MNPFQIMKAARIIMTRLRLDTGLILTEFERGTLHVNGRLEHVFSIEGRRTALNRELLHEMDRRFRRIEGVRQVQYNVSNWALNSDGHWAAKKPRN